jgi:hypothetical protein
MRINKARILPLCAIALGVGLVMVTSAFTKAPQTKTAQGNYTSYTFEYSGPDYTVAHVEDPSNWTYTTSSPSCSGNQIACSLQATDSYVDVSGSSPVLKSTINIQATLVPGPNTARVTGMDDPNGSFSNQTN